MRHILSNHLFSLEYFFGLPYLSSTHKSQYPILIHPIYTFIHFFICLNHLNFTFVIFIFTLFSSYRTYFHSPSYSSLSSLTFSFVQLTFSKHIKFLSNQHQALFNKFGVTHATRSELKQSSIFLRPIRSWKFFSSFLKKFFSFSLESSS